MGPAGAALLSWSLDAEARFGPSLLVRRFRWPSGLQLVHDVATYLYPQLDNSEEPGLLKKMLAENKGGAKSGQGFFTWNAERETRTLTRRNAEVIRHLQRLKKEE
jgi:3-hydroxyacyl-CoA dehydrogenase